MNAVLCTTEPEISTAEDREWWSGESNATAGDYCLAGGTGVEPGPEEMPEYLPMLAEAHGIPREVFRLVPGFEHYRVSDLGRVQTRVLPGCAGTCENWRDLRPRGTNSTGYPTVMLRNETSKKYATVHSLVLTAFVGPRPKGMHGCHANDIRTDNHLTNLRWDTPSANARDAIAHGVWPRGKGSHRAKLDDEKVRAIKARLADGETCTATARDYGVTLQLVWLISRGKSWKHVK